MRNRNSKRGRPKGHPKTGGRKPGTKNKVTVEGRAAAAEITDDPTYRRGLVTRARKGQLGPMEVWLWRMAKGNPTDDSVVSFEQLLSFVRYVTALFLDVVQDARLRQQFALGLRRKLPIGTDVGMDFVKSVPEIAPPIAKPSDDDEEYFDDMSAEALCKIIDGIRARGVTFEIFEDRWRVQRRLLSEHEVAALTANPDAVHRLLCAFGSEQEEEQETTVAGTLTLRPATVAPLPEPERPEAFRLSREKWEAAGIFVLNGIPTHSRGDQHAQRIISGEIPFEQAAAQQLATKDMLAAIQRTAPPFSLDQAPTLRDYLKED